MQRLLGGDATQDLTQRLLTRLPERAHRRVGRAGHHVRQLRGEGLQDRVGLHVWVLPRRPVRHRLPPYPGPRERRLRTHQVAQKVRRGLGRFGGGTDVARLYRGQSGAGKAGLGHQRQRSHAIGYVGGDLADKPGAV